MAGQSGSSGGEAEEGAARKAATSNGFFIGMHGFDSFDECAARTIARAVQGLRQVDKAWDGEWGKGAPCLKVTLKYLEDKGEMHKEPAVPL